MNRQEKIDTLFEKSLKMFQEKGYDNVKVTDICSAVNITKPTFYALHLTKDDLLKHAFQADYDELDPSWYDKEPTDLIEAIVDGVEVVNNRAVSLGKDLIRAFLKINLTKASLDVSWNQPWKERMLWLIQQAKSQKLILNQADAEMILNECMLYNVGYALYFSTEPGVTLDRDTYRYGVRVLLNTPRSRNRADSEKEKETDRFNTEQDEIRKGPDDQSKPGFLFEFSMKGREQV